MGRLLGRWMEDAALDSFSSRSFCVLGVFLGFRDLRRGSSVVASDAVHAAPLWLTARLHACVGPHLGGEAELAHLFAVGWDLRWL